MRVTPLDQILITVASTVDFRGRRAKFCCYLDRFEAWGDGDFDVGQCVGGVALLYIVLL